MVLLTMSEFDCWNLHTVKEDMRITHVLDHCVYISEEANVEFGFGLFREGGLNPN